MSLPAQLAAALDGFSGVSPRLVALDFDGVCAPIVDEPSAARMLPAVREALTLLQGIDDVRVALVSGRSLDDLRAVAEPDDDLLLVGSHGAETAAGDAEPEPLLDQAERELLARVRREVAEVVASHDGTQLEDKPAGVVLHTRRAPRDQARAATDALLERDPWPSGVQLRKGNEVVELSVLSADKGEALLRLKDLTGCRAVLYVGDDVTDEDAFGVLDQDAHDVAIKVGSAETAARYRIGAPDDLPAVLLALAQDR